MTNFKISPGLENNIRAAVKVINRYCNYEVIWKLSEDNSISKVLPGASLGDHELAVPTSLQVSDLAKDVVGENKPYEIANFLSFMTHIAFYFTEANLFELELLGLANLSGGIQEQFTLDNIHTEDPF